MKIKRDFITNSSSTAYIVAIPKDFIPDEEEIEDKYNEHLFEGDGILKPSELHKEFKECLDMLKLGEDLWFCGSDGCRSDIFYSITDICEANGFILSAFDISGEGNNRIQGIIGEEINKWFINTQLHKLKIEVPDEQN